MTCCLEDPTTGQVAVSMKRGDTMRLLVALTDKGGGPVDITGWTWLSQLRTDADDEASIAIQVIVTDEPGGLLQIELAPEITSTLPIRDYVFDVEATDGLGDKKTLIDGQLRVDKDVSR